MRRLTLRSRVLSRLLPAIVLACVGSVLSAPSAAAAQDYRVLQLNLCHSGANTSCFNGDNTIQEALSVISAQQPQAVSLNEVCRGDIARLAPAMGNGFSTFAPARRPDGTSVRCNNGDEYGNGLLFRSTGGTSFSGVYASQDSGSERRVYVCAEFADVIGCSTHLSNNSESVAMAQCKAAIAMLHDRAASGKPTFLAGDFNLKYAPIFGQNVQDCNASPFFRKGDGSVQHVFAANMTFTQTSVGDMTYTDHPSLLVSYTK